MESLRTCSDKWSLSNDVSLLKYLENFSQDIIEKTKSSLRLLDDLESDLIRTLVDVRTISSRFFTLADIQFVENRVREDEDLDRISNEEAIQNNNKEAISNEETLRKCISVFESKYEPVYMHESDSEDEPLGYRPVNNYLCRPLPHIIGSKEFMMDDNLGLNSSEETEDEESSVSSMSNNLEEVNPLPKGSSNKTDNELQTGNEFHESGNDDFTDDANSLNGSDRVGADGVVKDHSSFEDRNSSEPCHEPESGNLLTDQPHSVPESKFLSPKFVESNIFGQSIDLFKDSNPYPVSDSKHEVRKQTYITPPFAHQSTIPPALVDDSENSNDDDLFTVDVCSQGSSYDEVKPDPMSDKGKTFFLRDETEDFRKTLRHEETDGRNPSESGPHSKHGSQSLYRPNSLNLCYNENLPQFSQGSLNLFSDEEDDIFSKTEIKTKKLANVFPGAKDPKLIGYDYSKMSSLFDEDEPDDLFKPIQPQSTELPDCSPVIPDSLTRTDIEVKTSFNKTEPKITKLFKEYVETPDIENLMAIVPQSSMMKRNTSIESISEIKEGIVSILRKGLEGEISATFGGNLKPTGLKSNSNVKIQFEPKFGNEYQEGIPPDTSHLSNILKNRIRVQRKRRPPTRPGSQKNEMQNTKNEKSGDKAPGPYTEGSSLKGEGNEDNSNKLSNFVSPSTDEEDLFVLPSITLQEEKSFNDLFSGCVLMSPGQAIDSDTKSNKENNKNKTSQKQISGAVEENLSQETTQSSTPVIVDNISCGGSKERFNDVPLSYEGNLFNESVSETRDEGITDSDDDLFNESTKTAAISTMPKIKLLSNDDLFFVPTTSLTSSNEAMLAHFVQTKEEDSKESKDTDAIEPLENRKWQADHKKLPIEHGRNSDKDHELSSGATIHHSKALPDPLFSSLVEENGAKRQSSLFNTSSSDEESLFTSKVPSTSKRTAASKDIKSRIIKHSVSTLQTTSKKSFFDPLTSNMHGD